MKKALLASLLGWIFIPHLVKAQQANFTSDVVKGCAPLTVNFSDQSTGATTWSWDLGKGDTPSLVRNPSTVYSQPGTYQVKLTINGGQSTITKSIQVYGNPAVALSATPQSLCVPMTVKFHDDTPQESGNITSWNWIFGDGGVSSEQHPHYVYERPGDFSVTLIVKNEFGCESSLVKTSAVHANGTQSQFRTEPSEICSAPAIVNFSNQSIGSGDDALAYAWDFGDGDHSTQKEPSHEYKKSGEYTISLRATDTNGCNSISTSTIKIANEPAIDLIPSDVKLCIGDTLSFEVKSHDLIVSYDWNFGNGEFSSLVNPLVQYKQAGKYIVNLQAHLAGKSCLATVRKEIEVIADAIPKFTWKSLCDEKIEFTSTSENATQLLWEFKDKTSTKEVKFNHKFKEAAVDTIKLTAYNELGCKTTIKESIKIPADPVAKMSPGESQSCGQSLAGCVPYSLFVASVSLSELPITVNWILSDGTQSSEKNFGHNITKKGEYEIMLAVENTAGCRDTSRVKFQVADQKPIANFLIKKMELCQGEELVLYNKSQGADKLCWYFGDDDKPLTTTAVDSVVHKYGKPGRYLVSLVVKNAGCTDVIVATDSIIVNAPLAGFQFTKDCDNRTIDTFNYSEEYSSFSWDFGDGTTSTDLSPTHTFDGQGPYTVNLTVKNEGTQCIIEVLAVVSFQEPIPKFSVDIDKVCKGNPVRFTDESEFVKERAWVIYPPSGNHIVVFDSVAHSYQFHEPGTYQVTLAVSSPDGCYDFINDPEAIEVLDLTGEFDFTAVSNCQSLDVAYVSKTVGNPEAESWLWDFGDGAKSNEKDPHHVYQKPGKYAVSLTLGNGVGFCDVRKKDLINFTIPVVDFAMAKRDYCTFEPIQFNNQSKNATSFNWDLGNGLSTAPAPVNHYKTAGKYTIKLRATDQFGCAKEIIQPDYLAIFKPEAKFNALQISGACPPLITTFTDLSTGGVTNWNWDFGDGQKSITKNPVYTYRRPGIFNVALIVSDRVGCKDTVAMNSLVNLGGPYGKYIIPPSSCADDEITFKSEASNTVAYRWDFGDGIVQDGTSSIRHTYTQPGKYKPTLVLTDEKNCQVTIDQNEIITIFNLPEVDIVLLPDPPFAGEEVTLIGAGNEELKNTWTIGTQYHTGDTVKFTFDKVSEETIIALRSETVNGCVTEKEKEIVVQQDITFIPNVFTPNDDAINAAFEIDGIEKGYWGFHVYDRWGKSVYTSGNYQNEWDARGLPSGVYYYSLVNRLRRDKVYKGHVSVLK